MRATVTVDELNKLTSLIYAASVNWRHWSDFVEMVHDVSGGVRSAIHGFDTSTETPFAIAQSNFAPEFVESYFSYYGSISPWPAALGVAPVGQPLLAGSLVPHNDLSKTEFYNDWVRPQDDIACGAGVTLARNAGRVVIFAGNIRRKDADKLEKNFLRLIDVLTPHLQQALEINRMLAGRTVETAATAGAEPGAAILGLTPGGRIVFANSRAEALIECGSILGRDLRGRIVLPAAAQNVVQRLLDDMQGELAPGPRSLSLTGSDGVRWRAKMAALDGCGHDNSPFGVYYGLTGRCLLLALAQQSNDVELGQKLAHQFALSMAETDVAMSLTGGLSLPEIAEVRRVSIHTVRNQLKSALSKTGSHRQTDLVRLIERLR